MCSIKASKTEPKDKKLVWAKPEEDGYALYMYFNGRWAPVKTAGGSSEGGDDDTPVDTHECVDLGLPSGTVWATMNLGALLPEEYGGEYAWGETIAKTVANDYKFGEPPHTKYNSEDGLSQLELEDDAANVLWGEKWMIPTVDQWQELVDNCTWTWGTQNGVNGYTVSNNNKSIFLPAAGFFNTSPYDESKTQGTYFSSSLVETNLNAASYLLFVEQGVSVESPTNDSNRNIGLSIRPVTVKH